MHSNVLGTSPSAPARVPRRAPQPRPRAPPRESRGVREAPASADCAEGSPRGREPDAAAETRVADPRSPGRAECDSAPDEAEDDAAVEEALRFALDTLLDLSDDEGDDEGSKRDAAAVDAVLHEMLHEALREGTVEGDEAVADDAGDLEAFLGDGLGGAPPHDSRAGRGIAFAGASTTTPRRPSMSRSTSWSTPRWASTATRLVA